MMTKSISRAFQVATLATSLCASGGSAKAAGAPPFNPLTHCTDGGIPYPVGTHLCTSTDIVEICLSPQQAYGLRGIYLPSPNAKNVLRFDKAHWVATTSTRCREGDNGKVYRSTDPRR